MEGVDRAIRGRVWRGGNYTACKPRSILITYVVIQHVFSARHAALYCKIKRAVIYVGTNAVVIGRQIIQKILSIAETVE